MFTIIGGDGKEYGPVSVEQVREWLASGRASLDTRAKHIGYEQWKRLGDFDEFAPQPISAPPPLEGSSASVGTATPPASRWLRLGGALIDWVINSLCSLPTALPIMHSMGEQIASGRPDPQAIVGMVTDNIGKSVPYLLALLIVQACLVTMRGQSIGKILVGIRIVRFRDDSAAGFLHGFLIRSVAPWLIGRIPLLGFLFWIVDICFVFRDDHRCIHDLMADTKVVKK